MKLAEALQSRADLMTRLSELENRMTANALVQEGEKPAEQPDVLLKEYDACAGELEHLIVRINQTNASTTIDGETLTALLARRDILKLRLNAYRDLAREGSMSARRATRTEIRILPTVDAASLQKTADALAKELRLLDNRIQECNWTTELL